MNTKKSKKKYDESFKKDAVELYLQSGRTQSELADDLGVSLSAFNRWLREYRAVRQEEPSSGHIGEEYRKELLRLQEENRILRLERDILKKAARLFANDSK